VPVDASWRTKARLYDVRALGAVDSTLVQTWGSLPKAVQEQFSATYGRVGLVPPGKR